MHQLIVFGGESEGLVHPIEEDSLQIGRGEEADLRLQDALVSTLHARIERAGDGFRLIDLFSTNGTFKNGERVHTRTALVSGDIIQVGTTDLLFTDRDPRDALPPGSSAERSGMTLTLPLVHAMERAFSRAVDLDGLLESVALHFARATRGHEVAVAFDLQSDSPAWVFEAEVSGLQVVRRPLGHRLEPLRHALVVDSPLVVDGTLYLTLPTPAGPVGVVSVRPVQELTEAELGRLSMMAGLAAVHCRNKLLMAELTERNEELEAIRARLAAWNEELRTAVAERTVHLRLLASIVANVPDAVVSVSREGVVQSWNSGAQRLYGYAADEVLGDILPTIPDERVGELERLLAAAADGRTVTLRTVRVGRDDEEIPVQCTVFPVPDEEEGITRIVEIARDLSSQLDLEERMRWNERMASFGELATGLAHELANPLASLLLGVEYLLDRPRPHEESGQVLRVLHQEIQRLRRLTQQALDLARWERPDRRRLDLRPLLDYMAATLRQRAQEAGVSLTVRGESVHALGDSDQLKQALMNLATNALQAMDRGGELTLACEAEVGSGGLLRVTDTGRGIPAEDQERLFELFFSRREGGAGIGLAIAKRIVDAHAGRIEVESSPGGTAFTISLPLAGEDDS